MFNKFIVRQIEYSDNVAIADVIRTSLLDFDAAKPGTAYYDDNTDRIFEFFEAKKENARYWVIEQEKKVIGGGGFYPSPNLPSDTCELVKLYLYSDFRGKGLGKFLLEKCIDEAKNLGYQKMYLETMPELSAAIPMYEKYGFTYRTSSIGCSKFTGCNIWMIKDLD